MKFILTGRLTNNFVQLRMKILPKMNNQYFYRELPAWCKVCSFFIRGDLIILLPFLLLILLIGLFSIRFMLVALGVYIAVRELGEMIYWLLQQFGNRKYRPYDFGFKNLDNNAIYILYQTFSIAGMVVGITISLFAVLYL